MIQTIGDHNPKIIINPIVFKKIDLTPVKVILMKEIKKKEMIQREEIVLIEEIISKGETIQIGEMI